MCLTFVLALQEHEVWFQSPQLNKDVGKTEIAFREEPWKAVKNSNR